MPDPAPKRRGYVPPPISNRPDEGPAVGYAELHCKTNYSFLKGASHPDELVIQAADLRYSALAITDRNSLAGVVRAHVAAKDRQLKLLIGAEITPTDSAPVVLWSMNRTGYGRLCRLITLGCSRTEKGQCQLTRKDVADHSEGLLAGVLLAQTPLSELESQLRSCSDIFGDRCYALSELHHGPYDRQVFQRWHAAAESVGVPIAAANDVHYHDRNRQPLQDVLTSIRHGVSISQLRDRRFPNAERFLKSPAAMASLFREYPSAISRTEEIAGRCSFRLDELKYEYPEELCPRGLTPISYLCRITWEGARVRYPDGIPNKVRQLLEHELKLIDELNYPAYFLTVWDLVRFARSRGILCQGRGSAANSAVCFCLGVTAVDPSRIDVLFERFISKERDEAPDIDVDFEHERREEVLQYIYSKYGRDRAAMTAEVITYRAKSAIRDVGKALGLSLDRVNALSKQADHLSDIEQLRQRLPQAGLPTNSKLGERLLSLVQQLRDFPRHLSQHVGGMVLTRTPLSEVVPIENARMPGRTVLQWDKDDLDALGLLKVDCLSLGMLTALRKCLDLVRRHHRRTLTLASIPADDPVVYDMICKADTTGVFQIESRAQKAMLPRLRPRCYYDLVIEVALVRPGPIQGDMVHPYLRRRRGDEPVDYPDERVRSVLEKTLGVPLFQEQAMRLAMVAGGFTAGEADQLRRAMGAWRRRGVIDQFQEKLIQGMTANGYSAEFADRVFRQIRGFGEYGFPESHASSFALLVWASAWLKHHYPAAFTAAVLNSLPMGFYGPSQLVSDARDHGVRVLTVDVNSSHWDCTLEQANRFKPPDLRLGFRMILGFSQAQAERIVSQRGSRPFSSLDDFSHRTGLNHAALQRLSRADAFRSLGLNRRAALWESLEDKSSAPIFEDEHDELSAKELPKMPVLDEILADYGTLGLSLRGHPLRFLRSKLDSMRVHSAEELATIRNGKPVSVAGCVLFRQRPGTASGVTFVTLEDETGMSNLIVHPQVWERHFQVARTATIMLAKGVVQREGEVVHVLVAELRDLSQEFSAVRVRSRDFR